MINVADLTNPETGKTYREENMEQGWDIPVGSVVKLFNHYDAETRTYLETEDSLVLYVVKHGRDCDGTPLYWLSSQNHLEHKRVRDLAYLELIRGNTDLLQKFLIARHKGFWENGTLHFPTVFDKQEFENEYIVYQR